MSPILLGLNSVVLLSSNRKKVHLKGALFWVALRLQRVAMCCTSSVLQCVDSGCAQSSHAHIQATFKSQDPE